MPSFDRRRTRRTILAAFYVAGFVACTSNDSSVGCSPSLTCAIRQSEFDPPQRMDAGSSSCLVTGDRCAATALAAGTGFSCGVTVDGESLCWGTNDQEQLGGPSVPSELDAGVFGTFRFGLPNALHISAGGAHACAMTNESEVYCWGRNDEGQLNGVPSAEPAFINVGPAPMGLGGCSTECGALTFLDADDVAAGDKHTCVAGATLSPTSGVVCWGDNTYGQLGRPVGTGPAGAMGTVAETMGAMQVVAGARHTCARFFDGRVACWGELYDASGAWTITATPTPVPGLVDAIDLAAGAAHTCAIRQAGEVVCWGANDSGQLGDETTQPSAVPVRVHNIALAAHVAAGGTVDADRRAGHTCIVEIGLNVRCWGNDDHGQLGRDPSFPDSVAGYVVAPAGGDSTYLDNVEGIAAGPDQTCALDVNGRAWCWGSNALGQLGADVVGDSYRPVGVARFVGRAR